MPTTTAYRVWPRVPSSAGATQYIIDGTYKKKPTRVTAGTLHNTDLPWEDDSLHVFVACLQWAFYMLMGDPRAGQTVVQNGMAQYTGALGTAKLLLDQEAETEYRDLGDGAVAPEIPLVSYENLYF